MNFERLSKKQKRIAIARDVLKWLAGGRVTAKKSTYLKASRFTDDGKLNGCQACALGALFACAVEVKKDASMHNFYFNEGCMSSQSTMHDFLGEFFTREELMNIENAFEGRVDGALVNEKYEFDDERKFSELAVKFNAGIRSPKKRMQRIMRNIIANNGTFVP